MYLIGQRHIKGSSLDFSKITGLHKTSSLFSPQKIVKESITPHKEFDNFTNRVRMAKSESTTLDADKEIIQMMVK